jgi:hypothetical protein
VNPSPRYGGNVVGNAAARTALQGLTDPAGPLCGASLLAYLPTQRKGKEPVALKIPLTAGGSGNCASLTIPMDTWGPPPTKLEPILPTNWFVWGQPVLRQLYVAFSFSAYGTGGLFFANRVG